MFNNSKTISLNLFSPMMTGFLYHLYLIEINVKGLAIHGFERHF